MSSLPNGIYERVLDEELKFLLDSQPELRAVLRSIDDETEPHVYAQFLSQLLTQAFRITPHEDRIPLVNRLLQLLSDTQGLDYLSRHHLLNEKKNLLTSVSLQAQVLPRPVTPLGTSSLLTGQGSDPPLEHEIRSEMATANRVDILVSFIKWSGLRLLLPAFENLKDANVPIRILSTSYMGASDPEALEWLSKQPNIQVRLSYDTSRTRLHAKAYHFYRDSGYSAAYIGSANMSSAAMTQGLEWTVKVTAQDMPHILQRFEAEFSAYWESDEFEPFHEHDFTRFRKAIRSFKNQTTAGVAFFADITPKAFQHRILEALDAKRQAGNFRNLIVAATGTGKTVISALDYQRFALKAGRKPRLLFVVHRKEILEQALSCFRTVLKDQNFGELLVDGQVPTEWKHVFASVQSLNRKQPWESFGSDYFQYVVIDEAHHGKASSYRPLFDHLRPEILLGLTATPERTDGSSILPDFNDQFAAEIRLPEALEEKLLCPFHYFGISDCVELSDDRFWKNGRYDVEELNKVFTGDDFRALQRVDLVLQSLSKYQPNLDGIRCVGFCASVQHANFMAARFRERNLQAESLLGETPSEIRAERLRAFREGTLPFLFTVDVLSEGVDVPEINMVMFLRPTESLTVFLQQLGRGLRHAPEKECLTVLDFVGQTHRKYRMDRKFNALLSRNRQRIDKEIENDFPNLPSGCSIQLERIARQQILEKIRSVLEDLKHFIPETLATWSNETTLPLTFGNFIDQTGLSPGEVLKSKTWSQWKSLAGLQSAPTDPNIDKGKNALKRLTLRTDAETLSIFEDQNSDHTVQEPSAKFGTPQSIAAHYLMWGTKGENIGVSTLKQSFQRWHQNPSVLSDAAEIATWRKENISYPTKTCDLPFPCFLKLHAAYGSEEIKAALGLATLEKSGPAGQGVLHAKALKCYVHLVTFQKEEKDFSPTTRYQDYPISRTQLHWESQSTNTQDSETGKNYIFFKERGYTILFFTRVHKKVDNVTAPFIFLGSAKNLLSYKGNRPIQMVWELNDPMPAALFEAARPV